MVPGPADTAAQINAARRAGGRVIAVGTTAVRALETVAERAATSIPGEGWTELVVTPDQDVRAVDGLMTGWHEPAPLTWPCSRPSPGPNWSRRPTWPPWPRDISGTSSATATWSYHEAQRCSAEEQSRAGATRPSEPVELAPSEAAGQQVALAAMPAGRRAVLGRLKAAGEATADQVAAELGITVGAVRQLLGAARRAGLVAHRDERRGPGGPAAGTASPPPPRRCSQAVRPADQPAPGVHRGRRPGARHLARSTSGPTQRRERAEPRLAAAGSLEDQVIELARILDEDGYLADCAPAPDGGWLVTERNCAILDVARHHRQACGSELAFLREVLPNATVERVAHLLPAGRHCAYRIAPLSRPAPAKRSKPPPMAAGAPPAPDIRHLSPA